MASVKDHKSHEMGLHDETLTGRTQQVFFNSEESVNFFYDDAYEVDFNKRAEIDVEKLLCLEVNKKIKDLMKQGYGTIVLKNPAFVDGETGQELSAIQCIVSSNICCLIVFFPSPFSHFLCSSSCSFLCSIAPLL